MTALPSQLPPPAAPRSSNGAGSATAANGEHSGPEAGQTTVDQFGSLLDRSRPADLDDGRRCDRRDQTDNAAGHAGVEAKVPNDAVALDRRDPASGAGRVGGTGTAASGNPRGRHPSGARPLAETAAPRDARPAANGTSNGTEVSSRPGSVTSGVDGAGVSAAAASSTSTPTDAHNSADAKPAGTYAVPSFAASTASPTTTPDLAAAVAAAVIGTGNAGHAAPLVAAVAATPGSIVDLLPTAAADAPHAGTASTESANGVRTQILQQISLPGEGKAGMNRLTIRLEPEHLGRVTVELRAEGNRLTVVFDAESSVAREALREGGKELVDILIDRGGRRWSQVEVKLAERESDQRQHETDKRREDTRQQRQRNGTDGRNGRSNRQRWGG